jgi:hypothetical protein
MTASPQVYLTPLMIYLVVNRGLLASMRLRKHRRRFNRIGLRG